MSLGPVSPTVAGELVPRKVEVRPFGRHAIPRRHWWPRWTRDELYPKPVELVYRGGAMVSEVEMAWDVIGRWRFEGLNLYVDGQRTSVVEFSTQRDVGPLGWLIVEQIRVVL